MRETSWLVDAVGGDGDGGGDGHIGVEDDGRDVGVYEELDFTLEVAYGTLEFYILALLELGEADGFVGGILAADLETGAGAALTLFLEPDAASVAVGATTELKCLCQSHSVTTTPRTRTTCPWRTEVSLPAARSIGVWISWMVFKGGCAASKPKVRVMTTVRIWLTDNDEFTGSDFAGV